MKNTALCALCFGLLISTAGAAGSCAKPAVAVPEVVLDARPDYVALRARALEIARGKIEDPGGGWEPQMTCMPKSGIIWQWDSCFMALFAGYVPAGTDGLGNLDNLYRMQADDGYVAMAYRYADRMPAYGVRVNPPLYAWAEWSYARRTGDISRLPRAYDACSRLYRWLAANRTREPTGLYYFEDTGSSGMDNSPRSGYFAEHRKGSDVCFVDLACQQVLAAKCLAKIAPHVGKAGEAVGWQKEADALAEKVNRRHWCEKTGFYHDFWIDSCNKTQAKTAAGFWPLVAGVADARQVAALAAHAENPATFGTPYGVSSLSVDDPNYDPEGGYWLGSVWPPMVYMTVAGFRANGERALARRLAMRHLDQMVAVRAKGGEFDTVWECYSPTAPMPATARPGKRVKGDFVGWGGLGPFVMLVEDVVGLDVDALSRRVTWHLGEKGRQGVRNLPFASGRLSLVCTVAEDGAFSGVAEADDDLALEVFGLDGCRHSFALRRGSTAFSSASCAKPAAAGVLVREGETIAFLGDSITERGNLPTGYVNLVMKGLEVAGVNGVRKIPAGISGEKSNQMLARLDRDVLARKDGRRPDWMTLSCGVNDVWHGTNGVPLAAYKDNVSQILDRCAAAGVKVVVLTPTMIFEYPTSEQNVRLAPYVAWLREEARRRNLVCADLSAAMHAEEARRVAAGGFGGLTFDGVHMTSDGDRMMAWGVLEALGVPAQAKGAVFAAWDAMAASGAGKSRD